MPSRRQKEQDVEAQLHDQTNLLSNRQLVIVFSVMASTLLVTFIDQNGIGVMLPTVGEDLNAEATISWAGTSSLVANTVFQVLYGRLSDLFGRKLVFMSAVALLSFSDLMCGLAKNSTMLYVFRGLAGVAGGGIMSLTMMIVSDIVTLERRGKFQGILGSMVGLGNLIGPLIGASFAEKATWRGLFYLLCPIGVIGLVADYFLLPSTMPSEDFRGNLKKIDIWGVLSASAALVLLLIPISGGGSYFEWDSPMVISMLSVGGVFAVAFVIIEWKVAKLPMMPLSLYQDVAVAVLIGQNFFYGAVYYSNIYYIPLYTQNVLGKSPIISGLLLAPIVICQSIASTCAGLYISKRKRYGEVIWTGFTIWTLGQGLFCLFDRTISIAPIVVIEMLVGLGTGMVFQPTLIAMQAHCRKSQRAVVISNRNFIRSLGGAVGLAISAAVLQNSLKGHLPPQFKDLATNTYSSPNYSRYSLEASETIKDAYYEASHSVFVMLAPFMGVCLLSHWWVKDEGLTRPDEKPSEEQRSEKESTQDDSEENAEVCDHEVDKDNVKECSEEADGNSDDKEDGDKMPHLQQLDSQDHSNFFLVKTMSGR